MKYSAFARYGHLRFTSQPTEAQLIYERMVSGFGGEEMVADGGVGIDETIHARFYAKAMAIATAKRNFDRVRGNMRPDKSVELLPYHERTFGLTPLATDSDDARRTALAEAQLVSQGCRLDVIQTALSNLLGSHYVGVKVLGEDEYGVSPSDWSTPATRQGTWKPPTTIPKRRTTDTAITDLGSQSVATTYLGGATEMFVIGDTLVIDPGVPGIQEAVTVEGVSGDSITATFTKTHQAGAHLYTEPWPTALSTSRQLYVVTDSEVANSTAWRKKIYAKLNKLLRVVDTYEVVEESSVGAGFAGPFTVDNGIVAVTPIQVVEAYAGSAPSGPALSITDGDMSDPGTTAWTASSASLSKSSGRLLVQATNYGYAYQAIVGLSAGDPVRITGDVTVGYNWTAMVGIGAGITIKWAFGFTSGAEVTKSFDHEVVAPSGTNIILAVSGTGAVAAAFDNIVVERAI